MSWKIHQTSNFTNESSQRWMKESKIWKRHWRENSWQWSSYSSSFDILVNILIKQRRYWYFLCWNSMSLKTWRRKNDNHTRIFCRSLISLKVIWWMKAWGFWKDIKRITWKRGRNRFEIMKEKHRELVQRNYFKDLKRRLRLNISGSSLISKRRFKIDLGC